MINMDRKNDKNVNISIAQKIFENHKKKASNGKSTPLSDINLQEALKEKESKDRKKKKQANRRSNNMTSNAPAPLSNDSKMSIAGKIISSEKADNIIRHSYQFIKKNVIPFDL